jgi:hypothetical protein
MNKVKNALRALSAPAEIQDKLYPDFVAKGDELVLDYEEAKQECDFESSLSHQQLSAYRDLEDFLDQHAGKKYEEMYLETESLYKDARWHSIRTLAKNLLDAMHWVYQPPESNGSIYVSENEAGRNT